MIFSDNTLDLLKERLLHNIRGSKIERDEAVHYLLKNQYLKGRISKMVLNNSGDSDDGLMIFHDSVIAFMKYVIKHPNFELKNTHESYLTGIAHNLWISELRKRKVKISSRQLEDLNLQDSEALSVDLIMKGELKNKLELILSKMRSRCREVLMFWADGYKMKEIANKLGYKSDGMVRKKKNECLKEIYLYLKNHPEVAKQLRNR